MYSQPPWRDGISSYGISLPLELIAQTTLLSALRMPPLSSSEVRSQSTRVAMRTLLCDEVRYLWLMA